jgi:hypothetical protein
LAEAATYYVRAGGNDGADGRSHSTAWATLSKVSKQNLATSDIVLFHEADTFSGSLTVNWGGTSSAPAVVGAYYVNSSGAVTRGYAKSRPVIDGGNSLPSDHFDSLLRVRANRVRVENIKVINSRGRGIDVADSQSSTVIGCSIDGAYNSGIQFLRSASPRAEQNLVTHAGKGIKDGAPWGGGIEVSATTGAVVTHNTVSEVYGEGINANGGADGSVIENNYVYAARAVGIYADAAPNTTIRRNIVVGTTNSEYWRTSKTVGAGIALNNEKYHYEATVNALLTSIQSKRAKIYGNLVAFTSSGISIWGELAQSSFDGTLIFNNTLVDNDTQVFLQATPRPSSRFINNVLLSLSSSTRDVSGTDLGGMTAKNNYFSQGNPGGGYANSGNRFSGLKLSKMSGWRSIASSNQITWRDFDAANGSAGIGAGDDEPLSMSSGDNTYQLDYNAANHNDPMDMGAVKFGQQVATKPAAPENLALN